MAKLALKVGSTSQRVFVFIQDSSVTTGAGKVGLAFNTAGIKWYVAREDDGNAGGVAYTPATATLGTWTSIGFKEKDATNMPGVYELGIPNAAIAAGSKFSTIMISGMTGAAPCLLEIELVAYDPFDAIHLGLSSLPNTAITTNGSLITSGTGTDQISVTAGRIDIGKALGTAVTLDANNVLNVSTKYVGGTLQTAGDIPGKTNSLTFTVANQVDANSLSLAAALRPGIRKNTALTNFEIVMTDSTNHTPATGKTVTITRSIDHGAFSGGTLSAVTELANGVYYFDWGTGDLNGDIIMLRATASGCDDLLLLIRTNP